MISIKVVEVHKNDIKPGDTIILHGEMKTVCKNNIKKDEFFRTVIHGESFNLGCEKVKKVVFPIWKNGVVIN